MNPNKTRFKRKLMAVAVASYAMSGLSTTAVAQTDEMLEEVVVRGIRASIETSINTKRDAATVVDAITAEDIGKLPDVTISDSLQRISGVQIRRSAGEGSSVNIRGLPQVVTQLNGEQFLGSSSVVSVQPNFNEIPSQLFRGADVYKSATADLNRAGITGTVDLKTYRPFDFDEGLTAAGSFEVSTGEETGEFDPMISGLVNWQNNRVGFMLAGTYSNVNLANTYAGVSAGSPDAGGAAGWTGRSNDGNVIGNITGDPLANLGGVDLVDQGRSYLSQEGILAWHQVTERERIGLNASFQADLGEGWTLTSDWFYANREEYNRKVGVAATNKWQGNDWSYPTASRDTGEELDGNDFHTWQVGEMAPKRLASLTQNDVFDNTSRNVNVQLDYDNGGPFTATFRGVFGSAEQTRRMAFNEGDLTNASSTLGRTTNFVPGEQCTNGEEIVGDEGGCFQAINPLGYSENPHITYDTSGSHPHWSGFDRQLAGGLGAGNTTADYMSNLDSYNVGAYASENNEDAKGTLTALSLAGSYEIENNFFTSVDAGVRLSTRTADYSRWNYMAPANNTECEAQWLATDVELESDVCSAGETVDGEFVPYIALGNTRLDENNNAIWVDDFGSVTGIPGVWATDPRDYDDPVAFMERTFGEGSRVPVPGSTFYVEMEELSYYLQGNFEVGALTGNVGVKVIETDLLVQQNIAGPGIPFGNLNEDAGDVFTARSYTDVLPSVNLAYNLTDDLVLRAAYTQAMVPLNLNQYGDGLVLNYTIDSAEGSPTEGDFIVSGGSLSGNPQLDPWRSDNYDLSLEWYVGPASMLNVGLFRVEIDSFTEGQTVQMEQPDADGVVRRSVPINTTGQGSGGTLEGIELGAKIAFGDFLDGWIADFGIDTNFTYSPSEGEGEDIQGNTNPFPDNSKEQFNFSLWYESNRFQARIAHNYRSERLAATGAAWGALNVYQKATNYIDLSATYDINDNISVFFHGSNITGEIEEYYFEWDDQLAFQSYFEPRYSLGVRARF
ncbi:TonB-dependent receptor [Marinimicrobium sp. ABcell2]|uniref:TonB-dependent receptor n=1 Tax=Marinimicrobium sp. ABcell2 TaxID=3069751 RepID=UPI0027B73878|nr:TonB-dependent receptor [Marinimicrobium sp. ABcell2]MDQ2077160.1 TonB-dependent receptor [Marinimicrobium sp. ABcell2]